MRLTDRRRLPALSAAFITMVFWGFSFIASKYALNKGVPPLTLAFLRYAMLTPCAALLTQARTKSLRVSFRDLLRISPTALLGITAYYYCEYTGMMYTSASIAAVMLATIPILAALTESIVFKQKIAPVVWIGVLLSAIGAAMVTYAPGGAGTAFGYFMLFMTCVSWVLYIMLVRGVAADIEPLRLLSWQCVIALITLAPLAFNERARWAPLTPDVLLVTAILALVCSGACYIMYNYALVALGSIITSSMLNIIPIVSVITGALLLGERMTPLQLSGGAVIIVSTLLVVSMSKKQTE